MNEIHSSYRTYLRALSWFPRFPHGKQSMMPKTGWFENLRDLRHACGTSPRPQVAPDAGTCGSCGVPAEARTWLLRRLGASKSTHTDEEARILHFVGR
jgi:hypothetical protein